MKYSHLKTEDPVGTMTGRSFQVLFVDALLPSNVVLEAAFPGSPAVWSCLAFLERVTSGVNRGCPLLIFPKTACATSKSWGFPVAAMYFEPSAVHAPQAEGTCWLLPFGIGKKPVALLGAQTAPHVAGSPFRRLNSEVPG